MGLKHSFAHNVNDVRSLALAIKKTRAGAIHAGILYRKKNSGPLYVCHLEDHFKLTDKEVGTQIEFQWVDNDLHPTKQRIIASFVTSVVKKVGVTPIPYGYIRHNLSFSADGAYIKDQPGDGLTCASFILAVFEATHAPILDTADWPTRDEEDKAFRNAIILNLKNNHPNCDPRHIAALSTAVNIPRFRPAEVCVGSTISSVGWPVPFDVVARELPAFITEFESVS